MKCPKCKGRKTIRVRDRGPLGDGNTYNDETCRFCRGTGEVQDEVGVGTSIGGLKMYQNVHDLIQVMVELGGDWIASDDGDHIGFSRMPVDHDLWLGVPREALHRPWLGYRDWAKGSVLRTLMMSAQGRQKVAAMISDGKIDQLLKPAPPAWEAAETEKGRPDVERWLANAERVLSNMGPDYVDLWPEALRDACLYIQQLERASDEKAAHSWMITTLDFAVYETKEIHEHPTEYLNKHPKKVLIYAMPLAESDRGLDDVDTSRTQKVQ